MWYVSATLETFPLNRDRNPKRSCACQSPVASCLAPTCPSCSLQSPICVATFSTVSYPCGSRRSLSRYACSAEQLSDDDLLGQEHPSPIRSYLQRDLLKRHAHFLQQRAFFDFADMLPKDRYCFHKGARYESLTLRSVQSLFRQDNYAPRLDQERHPITIIGGVPGSGRHSVWSSIKAFTGEETTWRLLEQKMDVREGILKLLCYEDVDRSRKNWTRTTSNSSYRTSCSVERPRVLPLAVVDEPHRFPSPTRSSAF